MSHWNVVGKFTPVGARLADGHYSRRTVGSPQFMPPGETVVLVSEDGLSLFGWWRPHPASGIKAMNGLDGWTCTIYRRTGGALVASEAILQAEAALVAKGVTCGPSGLLTYVWDAKIESPNPGYCFKKAGYHVAGEAGCCAEMRPRSADKRKTLLRKPWASASRATPEGPLPTAAPQLSGPDLSPRGTALWNEVIAVVFDVSTQKLPTNLATAAIVRIFDRHQEAATKTGPPSRKPSEVVGWLTAEGHQDLSRAQLSVPAEPREKEKP